LVSFGHNIDGSTHDRYTYIGDLYWVVRLGGFGRAAARLNMTQPSVSARIAALEAEYGVRLFDRERGSRPVLTRKGAELFAHASRCLPCKRKR
jgi:DNA-binding transcriptional LysR family regulator